MSNKPALKEFFDQDSVQKKFAELLGKRSPAFITSVLQCISSNDLLSNADPVSVYHSAAVAATLDLPLNNVLGLAYIVPFNSKQKDGSYKTVAQFQIGYKGFIQLAQRSGQFKTISAAPIYEGQLIEANPLLGYRFDFSMKSSDKVLGYAGFFQLINGFEKTLFMSVDELKKHGSQFSQSYKNAKTRAYSLWETNFDAMATKTVIKLLLSKYAPLSIEMQKAVIADQGVINDEQGDNITYVDNMPVQHTDNSLLAASKERQRVADFIENCNTIKELTDVCKSISEDDIELIDMYNNKLITLQEASK